MSFDYAGGDEALEEREVKYAIRLPSKDNLWRNVEPGSGFEMEIPVYPV